MGKDFCACFSLSKLHLLTYKVSASSCSRPPDPASLMDGHLPLVGSAVFQGIWSQVADLNFIKMHFEVFKFHPG